MKNYLILILFVLSFFSGYGFSVCGVDVAEPWFIVKSFSGDDVLIVDNDGDLYLQGNSGLNFSYDEDLVIGGMNFNSNRAIFGNVLYNQVDFNQTGGMMVRSNIFENVAFFSQNDIRIKGSAAYERSQGNCLPDGGYCVGSVLEDRDYWCDITGVRDGSCRLDILSSVDCTLKNSSETDGGRDYENYGEVYDFIDCNPLDPNSYCTNDTYRDSCQSVSDLLEYFADGAGYDSEVINCDDELHYYWCDGLNRMKVVFGCDVVSDECSIVNPNYFVETCDDAGASTYTGWFCDSVEPGVRKRVRTDYYNACRVGACLVDDVKVDEFANCNPGQYCTGGSCQVITYSWSVGSCSVSCGGGTRDVWCKKDYNGERVSDSYCDASIRPSSSCNAQPCCVPSWGPSTNVICSGSSFTQNDGCGNTRIATGTKSSGSWSSVCGGSIATFPARDIGQKCEVHSDGCVSFNCGTCQSHSECNGAGVCESTGPR